jgi:hypothetical protein
MIKTFIFSIITVLSIQFGYSQKNAKPIISAQNFTNSTELWESIGLGIVNYQADVMYIYGKLYVTALMPDSPDHKLPTLSDAYLFPLYSQFKKNNGEILPGYAGDIFLILKLNSQPNQVYKQLYIEMRPFTDMLTVKTPGSEHQGKIRILINDPDQFEKINAINPGFLGLAGKLSDLEKNIDSGKMPLIEVDLSEITSWKGIGNIPFEDFVKIKDIVSKVHAQKKKISLINCPANKSIADLLQSTKADFINTSDPIQMAGFLEGKSK